jgi:SAM-dependent methyltransferase
MSSFAPPQSANSGFAAKPLHSGEAEFSRPLSDFRIAEQLINVRYPDIANQDRGPILSRIFTHIDFLRGTYPDIHDVAGKRFLDLACGATNYEDNGRGKYDPWMSRLLRHLDARPLGIDICPQQDENFESQQADLTIPDALSILDTASFDAVYVCAFPTRKMIQHLVERGIEWAPLRDNMMEHLARCLKPDGTIIRGFKGSDELLVEEAVAVARARLLPSSPDDEL